MLTVPLMYTAYSTQCFTGSGCFKACISKHPLTFVYLCYAYSDYVVKSHMQTECTGPLVQVFHFKNKERCSKRKKYQDIFKIPYLTDVIHGKKKNQTYKLGVYWVLSHCPLVSLTAAYGGN